MNAIHALGESTSMEIRKAKTQGFCFGVAITVKKAEEAIASRNDVTTLGHVVHNPQMVEKLEAQPACATRTSVDEVESGALFVRAHGLPVDVFEKAQAKGLDDHRRDLPDGHQDSRAGRAPQSRRLQDHRDRRSASSRKSKARSVTCPAPGASRRSKTSKKLPRGSKVGVVVQSTYSRERFTDIVKALSEKYYEVRAVNTICTDTQQPPDRSAAPRARGRSDGRRRRQDLGQHQASCGTLGIVRRALVSHRRPRRIASRVVRRRPASRA